MHKIDLKLMIKLSKHFLILILDIYFLIPKYLFFGMNLLKYLVQTMHYKMKKQIKI